MVVKRLAQNQDAIQKQEALFADNVDVALDQVIYARLSNRTENRTLVQPTTNDSKFDRFLVDMNDIHRGISTSSEIQVVDNYLGGFGIDEKYPFQDDKYSVAPWIEIGEQNPIRNVVSIPELGFFPDNVIDRATGSNVVNRSSAQAEVRRQNG